MAALSNLLALYRGGHGTTVHDTVNIGSSGTFAGATYANGSRFVLPGADADRIIVTPLANTIGFAVSAILYQNNAFGFPWNVGPLSGGYVIRSGIIQWSDGSFTRSWSPASWQFPIATRYHIYIDKPHGKPMRVWADGIEIPGTSGTHNTVNTSFALGSNGGSNRCAGYVEELAVLNAEALTSPEIAAAAADGIASVFLGGGASAKPTINSPHLMGYAG